MGPRCEQDNQVVGIVPEVWSPCHILRVDQEGTYPAVVAVLPQVVHQDHKVGSFAAAFLPSPFVARNAENDPTSDLVNLPAGVIR